MSETTIRPTRRLAALSVLLMLGALAAAPSVGVVGATPTRFAVVKENGTLVRGSGVDSVTRLSDGRYDVKFTGGVANCAYLATTVNLYSQALVVYTSRSPSSVRTVNVETKNQGGGLTDGPFHLVIACTSTGQRFAVVDATGSIARATTGTSIVSPGVGRYQVKFAASVASCAYVATVADPGTSIVFNPNNVSTGSGNTSRTVYVETKNPGGGLTTGIPFHLAVICPSSTTRVAVVNGAGIAVRGSALTSSFRPGTGSYRFVTNRNIATQCATLATRGSVNTNVPFNPATVELVDGPALNTVGLDVRALQALGGTASNQSIHVAVVC